MKELLAILSAIIFSGITIAILEKLRKRKQLKKYKEIKERLRRMIETEEE